MLKILDNLWAKFFSLLIGGLIWFHVATEKPYNYEVHLPITKVDLKENLVLVHNLTDTVIAGVTATGKQLLREKWQAQGVRLSAVSLPVGQQVISLTPSNLNLVSTAVGIKIHDVLSPATVTLDIDNQFVLRLPVTPAIAATADNGFAVARRMDVSPEQVTVVGPRSVIKELPSLSTETRTFRGLRADTAVKLAVEHPAGSNLRIVPDSVMAMVRVVPSKTRTYDNLQVVIFNAPPGASVVTDPPLVRVDLAGSPDDIDLLNRTALIVSVDYREQSAAHRAKLKVDRPSNFSVAHLSTDSVRIIEEK